MSWFLVGSKFSLIGSIKRYLTASVATALSSTTILILLLIPLSVVNVAVIPEAFNASTAAAVCDAGVLILKVT